MCRFLPSSPWHCVVAAKSSFVFFRARKLPESCSKQAGVSVASSLPWPAVSFPRAAARGGARLCPRQRMNRQLRKGECRLADFSRLAGYHGHIAESYQRDKSILVLAQVL